MRKLVFGINLTADGCCDHTAGIPDEEVHSFFACLTRDAGALLYGRKTYELMVPYWPDIAKSNSGRTDAEKEFAEAFVSVPQMVVVSKTLSGVEGKSAIIIRSNLQDEIRKLKQEPGRDILTGGVSLPSELLELGLIDEVRLVIHPVVAGKGRRLFDTVHLPEQLHLKLVGSQVFNSGCVALHYVKR